MDAAAQYVGEIGIGDGWWLVLPEVHYDDVELENATGPSFGNEHRIVMTQVVAVDAQTPIEKVIEIAETSSGKSAGTNAAVRDLGVASGRGWRGSVSVETLTEGDEYQLSASMAGAGPAFLIVTIRFRSTEGERGAHEIIRQTFHDPDSAAEMNASVAP